MKLNGLVLNHTDFPTNIKFADLPETNNYKIFIHYVQKDMSCNMLAKMLIKCFDETASKGKSTDFTFRFRGAKSSKFLSKFPEMIAMLITMTYDKDSERDSVHH